MHGASRLGWMLAAALVLPAAASPETAAPAAEGSLPADLGELLARRAAEYDEKTLGFQCLETAITEELDVDGTAVDVKLKERRYLLERSEGNELFRALRSKPGKRRLSETSPFPFPEPFAWTQLFDETLAETFRFEAGELTTVADRKALPIRFESSQPVEEGRSIREWSGIAWVDAERGDILRIDAEPNSQDAAMLDAHRRWVRSTTIRWEAMTFKAAPEPRGQQIQVDFRQLHEGLLYPSRTILFGVRLTREADLVLDSRTLLEYVDYRFFRAEADGSREP